MISPTMSAKHPFTLTVSVRDPLVRKTWTLMQGMMERAFYLNRLNQIYRRVTGAAETSGSFLERVMEEMDLRYEAEGLDIQRIPREGPCVVVANHPFGAVEGVVLAALLRKVRPDVRILANHLLARVPELRDQFIFVNPFGGHNAARTNLQPLRECLQWLREGGLLAVFPAGEVSHVQWRQGRVADPEWHPAPGWLIQKARATVVPMYFEGANGPLFQVAGLIHPRLRTAMLPYEFCNKQGSAIRIRVGRAMPFSRLEKWTRPEDLMRYLRLRTYLLAHRAESAVRRRPRRRPAERRFEPIAVPVSPDHLEQEVHDLPSIQCLLTQSEFQVFFTRARQAPGLLHEIGRLRETTFRATHEGTGRALDLDRYDLDYMHLFVWNAAARELVGAYRLGPTDDILRHRGVRGLYTRTLFRYRPALLRSMSPALELGRSFVRPEYQKQYAPLLLLWKGIGAFVARHPRYRNLFGPVSINQDYLSTSRWMMMRYLEANRMDAELARLVRPRHAPRWPRPDGEQIHFTRVVGSLDEVSELIEDIEKDRKGIPILLKQYLKLGGRLLAFNVDPQFSHVLDGLIWVDLLKTEPRTLTKYMGEEGCRRFLSYHAEDHRPVGDGDAESHTASYPPGIPAPAPA